MQNERIDRLAAVVDRGVAADFDGAAFRVDLGLADGGASRVGRNPPGEACLRRKRTAQVAGQRGELVGGACNIKQVQPAIGVRRYEQTIREGDIACGGLEHDGGDAARFFDHRPRRLDHQRSRKAHGTVGMGPAAGSKRRAIAADEIDRLRVDTELIRNHLPEARLVALSARLGPDDEHDVTCGRDLDGDTLVRHAHWRLDVIGDTEPQQPAAPFRLLAARRKAVQVRSFERASEIAGEIAAVVSESGCRAMGQLIVADQIAPA